MKEGASKEEEEVRDARSCCVVLTLPCLFFLLFGLPSLVDKSKPAIELASMEFTVLNITQTHLSAKWDSSIRIPSDLPNTYICLQGNLETSILYKDFTLATSTQKYNDLEYDSPQLLEISTNVSEKDIGGLIGNEIMKDVKERKEVKFGTRFFLTDCRQKRTRMMRYVCHEVTLRFEPSSDMKATMVESLQNHPSCFNA